MNDVVASIIRDLEAVIASANAAIDRARALEARAAVEAPQQDEGLEFVALCVAAFESGISDSRLRDLCKSHPLDAPGGFGFKEGGRWKVHQGRYRAFCAAQPRKGRRKR